jgi:hypothetical protein
LAAALGRPADVDEEPREIQVLGVVSRAIQLHKADFDLFVIENVVSFSGSERVGKVIGDIDRGVQQLAVAGCVVPGHGPFEEMSGGEARAIATIRPHAFLSAQLSDGTVKRALDTGSKCGVLLYAEDVRGGFDEPPFDRAIRGSVIEQHRKRNGPVLVDARSPELVLDFDVFDGRRRNREVGCGARRRLENADGR